MSKNKNAQLAHLAYSAHGARGFTIIELLIVIIVIGILATLVLIGYNNITKQAAVATLKSDTDATRRNIELYATNNNGTILPEASAASVIQLPAGETYEYSNRTTSFCVTVTSSKALTSFYYDSAVPGLTQGACSGHLGYTTSPVNASGTVTTVAGSATTGSSDGTGAAAQFGANNFYLVSDPAGNMYVSDATNNDIRKVTPAGVVTTLAGSPTPGSANGTGAAASFRDMRGIVVDSSNNLIIADTANNLIRKVTPAGVVTTLAGSTNGFADGTGTAAQFSQPVSMAIDSSDNVYVVDYTNLRIRKITPAGVVTTLAGNGTNAYVDATGTAASFRAPNAMTIDSTGTLTVSDTNAGGQRILRKVTSAGAVTTMMSMLGQPTLYNMWTDLSTNDIYYASSNNNKIMRIRPNGDISTFLGNGGYGMTDGPTATAQNSYPSGITFNASNRTLYFTDTYRVRKIVLS